MSVSMRITQGMLARTTLSDLEGVASRLADTQRKLSSGKQITRPSDDPYGASRALQLRGDLAAQNQYEANADDGIAWQNVADASLSSINDATQRARELLVQGGSDSASPASRQAIAAEIDQLIDEVKHSANAQYAGQYVFAGTATTTTPYAVGGSDTYAGDSGTIAREIGPGVSVPVNHDITSVLGNGQGAADGKLLNTLRDIAQHLRGGTTADANALRTNDLQNLDSNLTALSGLRAGVGALTNRLDTAVSRIGDLQENTTKALSDTEDADMAQTLVAYSTQQASYQAALRAGANIVQQSLLDFLH